MDVSVIVPTRNRSALLAMTLRSVAWQRDVGLEVIVVDDASSDDTPAVVAAIEDPRFRLIRCRTPGGVAAARNLGANEASGEWLAFVDDDDLWAPDKLARQLHAASECGRDWAYTGAVVINTRGGIIRAQVPLPPEETVRALLRYDAVPGGGSNVVMRRTTWQHTGPFATDLPTVEDWDMWLRLARRGLPACVPSPLIARRLHGSNTTLNTVEIVRGTRRLEQRHDTTADWGKLHRWMGHMSLRAGRRRTALGQFARAVLHGELRGVAGDLGAMLKAQLRRFPSTEAGSPASRDPWIVTASAWLHEFERGAHQVRETAGATGISRESPPLG
jgi:glycosyltransferase involved in cell wall biosynthesis